MALPNRSITADWPDIPFSAWSDTATTLHLWTQIVGKIRLRQTPWTNHSWHVPLYLTARGLTTSPIAVHGDGLEIRFDFIAHRLRIDTTKGARFELALQAMTVADFYSELMQGLAGLGYPITINTTPSELADAIPFDEDQTHHDYDAEYANRFWRALIQIDRVFKEFRAGFVGKNSPVHFFWGSFDIAVTRFSGREAPEHPGGIPNFPDWVAREAYSHEVSSAGFWPGAGIGYPAFYAYAYPSPEGFAAADVTPDEAFWSADLGEFILPYDAVRCAASPDAALLAFLQSTHAAAADLAAWDRAALERRLPPD